jgi:DeoR family transcriptional regulator, suf operon transcriptional repressor
MADTKQEILALLARQEWSAQGLAEQMGMTPAGVRQHVTALEAQGLVTHRKQGGEPNRPTLLYRLSEDGKEAFPKRYDLLARMLVQSVKEQVGPEGAMRLVERVGEKVAAELPAGHAADPKIHRREVLAALERELSWEGKIAEKPSGGIEITLYQCPFQSVSKQHPDVCPAFFGGLFRTLLEAGSVSCTPITDGPDAGIACCRLEIDT